jgi:outer membrane assembly lipoprotein YfiO
MGLLLLATVLAAVGCAGKKKAAREAADLSAGASFERATQFLVKRDLRQALSALSRIQLAPEVRAEIEPLSRLARADATFYQGTVIAWIDARTLYMDFASLNREHVLAPYAQLQVGRCSLLQVNDPTKDQALTRQAIADLEAVEQRWPDSPYVVAARAMLREARANLAEAEFLIGRFYLKRRQHEAAIARLRGIVATFPDYPEADKVLYYLADAHAQSGGTAIALGYLSRLLSSYPSSAYLDPARRLQASLEARPLTAEDL